MFDVTFTFILGISEVYVEESRSLNGSFKELSVVYMRVERHKVDCYANWSAPEALVVIEQQPL